MISFGIGLLATNLPYTIVLTPQAIDFPKYINASQEYFKNYETDYLLSSSGRSSPHITVVQFREESQDRVFEVWSHLCERLAEKERSWTPEFKGISYLQEGTKSWVELSIERSNELTELHELAKEEIVPLNAAGNRYRPHLTLAKFELPQTIRSFDLAALGKTKSFTLELGRSDDKWQYSKSLAMYAGRPEGISWVNGLIEKYPEILWLADEGVRKTEEGNSIVNSPYSSQLFGKEFIEFDRTIMTLRSLYLFLEGSDRAYREFTAGQPEEKRLSRASFNEVHNQAQELLSSGWNGLSGKEMAQAMETALVLGDMGKTALARELFSNIKAPD